MIVFVLFPSLVLMSALASPAAALTIDPAENTTPKVEVKQLKRDLHHGSHHYNFASPPSPSSSPPPTHPHLVYPSNSIQPLAVPVSSTKDGMVDFSGAKLDPLTGKMCVTKEDFVPSLQKDPVLRCDHKKVRQCHFTYITKFSSQEEEVCDENFEKVCQIVFRQQATNETIRKCYKPLGISCDDQAGQGYPLPSYDFQGGNSIGGGGGGGGGGRDDEEVCQTFYESSCTTRYRESRPGQFVGDTRCQKLPRRLCGKPACRAVEGPEECHDQIVAAVTDVPEETCDLNPQEVCRLQTRLVPRLEPVEDCRYRPKQVCRVDFSAPRKTQRPLKVKLCLSDDKAPPPPPPPPRPTYYSPPSPTPPSPTPSSAPLGTTYYKPLPSASPSISSSYSSSATTSYNQI